MYRVAVTNDALPRDPIRAGGIEATVCVGNDVTRYTRCGCGPTVLMLRPSEGDLQPWQEVEKAISGHFRVVHPRVDPSCKDFGSWLSGFLDGLGLERIRIVAGDGYGVPAITFSLLEPDRVDRVVLLCRLSPDQADLEASLGDSFSHSTRPLLVARLGSEKAEVTDRVLAFLGGADSTAGQEPSK